MLTPADEAACEQWIRLHSRSFYLASKLLPARVRGASWALYAFCRRTDDAVDEGEQGEAARPRLAALERGLDRVYGDHGHVVDPRSLDDVVDRSFALVAREHGIPRGVPAALLAGMAMDAEGHRYESLDDLYVYGFRVASTVGLMMTLVMGAREPETLLRACELGVGMQLTNIARDVGEDAGRGRVYLPDDLLALAGTSREAVLAARHGAWPIREAVRRLLGVADDFYRSADRGIAALPPDCRLAIASARRIYAAIGDDLARHSFDSVTRRAHTSSAQKLALVASAVPLALRPPSRSGAGPADALLSELMAECGLRLDPVPAPWRWRPGSFTLRPRVFENDVTQIEVIVPTILAVGCSQSFVEVCRRVAARVGVMVEPVLLDGLATIVASRKPRLMVVKQHIYDFDPSEFDLLARDVGSGLLIIDGEEIAYTALERQLLAALREGQGLRRPML